MCAALAICSQGVATARDASAPSDGGVPVASAVSELWLAVRINGVDARAPARLARQTDGRVFASADDLAAWRIRAPAVAPSDLKGRQYLSLDAIVGLTYRVDEPGQVLVLDGGPDIFTVTRLGPQPAPRRRPDVGPAGAFINYDVQAGSTDGLQALDGQIEFGMFNPLGFGSTTFLGHGGGGARRVVRLDTAWTHDQPSALRSFVIGDSATHGGSWGNSVRFGGLQWATNFAVRPDFVPFVLPTIRGEAVLPSSVDLYVDNALRMTSSVPSGPFEIARAPVLSGDGQVRLVVRDLFGRETVIAQPYYVSTTLLPPDLRDEAYEIGFVRRRYAITSNDYGPAFGAATVRAGIDERTTVEWRGEMLAKQQTVGASANRLIASKVQFNGSLAFSHRPEGAGSLLALAIDRQSRPFSFSLQTRLATPRFAELGGWPDANTPQRAHLAHTSYTADHGGSFFASYVEQAGPASSRVRFCTVGYNVGLADRLYLSAFALHTLEGQRSDSIGINLTWALGQRTSSAVSHRRDATGSASGVQVQQSLPQGSGMGYRLATTTGPAGHDDATLLMQNEIGTYSLAVDRFQRSTSYRALAGGGVAIIDGRTYLARRIDDSFAIVKVGDYAGVDVYLENQRVARTDATGHALVPRLRAYQSNVITVPPDKLPLDSDFTDLRLELTPARRSAVTAVFPARPSRGALLRIVLDDGAPLPSGAVVNVVGSSDEFPVARRGEAFVKGLTQHSIVRAHWKEQRCDIQVELLPQAGPVPVIGPLLCTGVRP